MGSVVMLKFDTMYGSRNFPRMSVDFSFQQGHVFSVCYYVFSVYLEDNYRRSHDKTNLMRLVNKTILRTIAPLLFWAEFAVFRNLSPSL